MTDKLKPVKCGCGGEAKVIKYRSCVDGVIRWFVLCTNCNIITAQYPIESEAITAWNRAMGVDVNSVVSVFSSEVKNE